ncbi:MAG: CatA-like O-acetyltransferase [Saccharofermentanales bacterium]
MKTIDLNDWDRTTLYLFFKRMDFPQYNICTNIDITNFYKKTKEQGISFYYAMVYAAMNALNQVENFKYRIHGDQVVLYDTIHPSFTDMSKGSEMFKMVNVDMKDSITEFVENASKKSKEQTDFISPEEEKRDDMAYITCLPWVTFTQLTHTMSLNKEDAVPRLSWGKYFDADGKRLLPFSVQAHHSFVDGIHIGRYIDALQKYLDEY